ncbi:hypothetical protein ACHZ98_33870 [Streptomyces sp. MAR4 CNY-716]
MAQFLLRLADGSDEIIEADVVGRRTSGEIVVERANWRGDWEELTSYRARAVTAVFRRGPVEGGTYGWIPQPADGSWWCY